MSTSHAWNRGWVFADVMTKDLNSGIIPGYLGGPASSDSVLRRDRKGLAQRRSHVKMEAEMGGMQPPARAAWSPRRWTRQEGPTPGGLEGPWPSDTWILDLWPPDCDIISSCFLSCLGCGHLSSRHSQVPRTMCPPSLDLSFEDTKG